MNYRHAYHAGNYADVFKHTILIVLLRALAKKETPFFVLDTHGGRGVYDLRGTEARKTGEQESGVGKLSAEDWARLADYRAAIDAVNDPGEVAIYPGSPRIIRHFLRPQDRMAVLELHPEDHAALKAEFRADPRAAIHHRDSWEGLRALVPPKERRGLVLIDPAFEAKDEFPQLLSAIEDAHRKWATGIYAIWYPLKYPDLVEWFRKGIERAGIRKVFDAELEAGCGMAIINPPWQSDRAIEELLRVLEPALKMRARSSWWVPE